MLWSNYKRVRGKKKNLFRVRHFAARLTTGLSNYLSSGTGEPTRDFAEEQSGEIDTTDLVYAEYKRNFSEPIDPPSPHINTELVPQPPL